MQDKVKAIADKYTTEDRILLLIEECGELIAAANHYRRDRLAKKYGKHEVAEEIADVMVMCSQVAYKLNIPDSEIERLIEFKLNRTIERMDK